MSQLFEEARLNHLIIDNPTEGIKITPHAKAEKKKALLPDEVDILMNVVVEPRARVFCALCLYCGLRKEEALGLQWSDIQSSSLTIRRAMTFLNNQQDPVDDLKTKAAHRVVPIPDKLRSVLLDTPHLSRYIVPAAPHSPGCGTLTLRPLCRSPCIPTCCGTPTQRHFIVQG